MPCDSRVQELDARLLKPQNDLMSGGVLDLVKAQRRNLVWHNHSVLNCLQELNSRFSRPLREVLSIESEVDDAALISIDSKGVDIRVRQGAQVLF